MASVKKILLLIETSRGFGQDLLTGIARYARFHGPWSFYTYPPFFRSNQKNQTILRNLRDKGIHGIISREMTDFEEMAKMNVPMIFASTIKPKNIDVPDNIPTIHCDNQTISTLAAEHLINCGFRHFGYCGYQNIGWSRIRGDAFRTFLQGKNICPWFYEQPQSKRKQMWQHEQAVLIEWLKSLPKPIGIMTCSDDRSKDLIEAAKVAGINVPEEVAVIGVDNDPIACELSHPTLSSVALDTESAGFKAAELLDHLMNNDEDMTGQKIIIKPTFAQVRHSTDILVVEDKEVLAAMRYIKDHVRQPIQVEDVVQSTCLCRRSLERRFMQTISRSIHAEISRARIEQTCKMLIETNMSQLQIAHALGYGSIDNLRRFFHRQTKMTLLEYRKQHRQVLTNVSAD